MRRIAALAIVLALCAVLSACGSSLPSSATGVRAAMVAAALAQKSVHWTEEDGAADTGYYESERISADVTTDGGRARLTNWPQGKTEFRLVNDVVYVRGNAEGLRFQLQLTKAQAASYAGRWISIPKGGWLYAETSDGLTLASIVHDFTPVVGRFGDGKLVARDGPTGTDGPTGPQGPTGAGGEAESGEGRPVILSATGPTGATLTLHASGQPLPAAFTGHCDFCWDTGRFSKWNEPVHVEAPAHSTPIATVRSG